VQGVNIFLHNLKAKAAARKLQENKGIVFHNIPINLIHSNISSVR
jgi:hypothetical protein